MKTALKLILICVISINAVAQNSVWSLPPDYRQTNNLNTPIPLPTPNYPNAFNGVWPGPSGSVIGPHNAYKNNNNEPLFFYIDRNIYNENGYLIDELSANLSSTPDDAEGWSEACIIPNPANCKQYYIFSSYLTYPNGVKSHAPCFALIDVSQNNPNGPTGELGKNITPNQIPGTKTVENLYTFTNTPPVSPGGPLPYNGDIHYAATKEYNGYRLLFLSNNDEIIIYKITNNPTAPIVHLSTYIIAAFGNLQPSGYPLGATSREVNKTEFELFEDPLNNKIKVAVGVPETNTPNFSHNHLFLGEFDYNGNYTANSAKAVSIRPLSGSSLSLIYGVEFSPDGNWVYFSHTKNITYPNPLEVVNFASPTTRYSIQPPGINMLDFEKSQIEITSNGNLVLATSNRLASISNANSPTSFVWNNNIATLNNYPLQYPLSVINTSGQSLLSSYILPDQIDQEVYGNFFFSSTECCQFYSNYDQYNYTSALGSQSWTGTSNPLNNNSGNIVTIGNELRIPAGSNITITGMTIKFAPTAKLVIEGNNSPQIAGRLTLLNCTLTVDNRCDPNVIWQGVRVYGNGNLAQSSWSTTPHGWMKFTNSQIDHAVTGIEIQNGGIAQGITSTLKNNNMGIYMTGFSPSTGTNNTTSFDRCNFITSSGTYISQPWRLAFLLNQKLNVSFYGCSFSNQHGAFNYLYDAVYASNSKLSFFDKVVSSVTTHCTFENCRYGIFATTTNKSGRTLSCNNAIFNKNATGIYIANNDYCVIKGNSFNVLDNSSAVTYGVGLYIDNSMGFTVTENNFKNFSLGIANPTLTFGVIAKKTNSSAARCSCVADNNTIYKNYFSNLHQGIQTLDSNRFSLPPTYDGGLKMECNIFSQTIVWSDIGVYSGGINYHQGYNDYAAGNQFSRTPSGLDYYLHSANPPTQYLWHSAIPNGQPLLYSNNNFTPAQITSNTNTCASGGSQRMNLNSREYVKTKTLRFYEITGQLKSNKSKDINNNANRNVEDMYVTYNEIANLKREIVSTFLNDTTEGSLDSALFYINVFDYFENKNGKLVGSNLALGKSDDASIAKAKVSNSEPGSNYDKLMGLQLQLEGKDLKEEFTIDPSKITLLNNIANDVSDHESRLIALAYLNSVMEYPYQPEVLVPEFVNNVNQRLGNNDKIINELVINKLIVAPNPFNESTEIFTNIGDNKKEAQLHISDMSGKIITKYNLKKGENKVKFENNKGVKGNLICTLIIDGRKIETKIIVAIE